MSVGLDSPSRDVLLDGVGVVIVTLIVKLRISRSRRMPRCIVLPRVLLLFKRGDAWLHSKETGLRKRLHCDM